MSLVFNTKTYNSDSFAADSVGYIGAAKTVTVKDDLKLNRTRPKATSVFSGVGRATAKLTRTLTLTGALTPTGDALVEINVSVPAGYASADVDALLNDMGALLSGADMKTLVKSQKISY
jgi:hypothetical protein